MSYYLLTVQKPGTVTYKAVANAKHHVEADSLELAQWRADQLIDDHYAKDEKATFRLFDETGLVATRQGDGRWA
jgi:hypothetical protein